MRPEGETKSVKPPNCSPTGQRFCYHTEHFPIRTFFFFAFCVFYLFKCKFLHFFFFFFFSGGETHPNSLDLHSHQCHAVQRIQLSPISPQGLLPSSPFLLLPPPPQTTHRGAAPHAGGLNPSIIAEELGVEGQGCFLAAFDSHAV